MDTKELIKKVRKVEIKTRGLSNQIFSGEYHSAFKGRGMAFSEVREYQPGDDIRAIDWNVTARFNHPYVKIFEEERELTMMLLVDVSGSENFGSSLRLKRDMATELAAILAFSAMQNNDKIGVIFFSDRIEKFIPPKKGRSHILHIIREMINFEPERSQTDISCALRHLTNVIKKRSIAFVISDFMDAGFEQALRIANKKHDVVAIQLYDQRDLELPSVGLIRLRDPETGKQMVVDSNAAHVRRAYFAAGRQKEAVLKETFLRSGVDHLKIRTDESYIRYLMNFFKSREARA
ncbi:MAG: DUF58 domain-containing protein [Flavobacteriales bacterium]|nr:DUF58 domain-containing protein [Flavobacteriales bacterium]MCB9448785.1 DUF58 domain-containing protein [Flavobacteriales bacterium]